MHYKLAERLKKARQGAQRRALEEAAGVSNGVISSIEDDGRVPLLDTVERLARALKLSPCALAFGREGDPASMDSPLGCEGTGKRLLELREAQSLSLRALARAANMTPSGVSSVETGRSMPSVATVEGLAKALGVSPCWLAYGEGPKVIEKPQRRAVKKSPPAERRARRSAR